jgi:hypothetical protein
MYKDKLKWKFKEKSYMNTCFLWGGCLAWWIKKKVTCYKVIVIHNVNEKFTFIGKWDRTFMVNIWQYVASRD